MFVLICGPIASGKSTLAQRVAGELARGEVPTAVIDLDVVHAMIVSGPGGPPYETWPLARRAAVDLAASFEDQGTAVIILEGSFPAPEAIRETLTSEGRRSLVVALRVSYAEALRRVNADPSRGLSRDPTFLSAYYAEPQHTRLDNSDLVIDTERVTESDATALIVDAVRDRMNERGNGGDDRIRTGE
jgi:shikimate kinase